VKHASGRIAEFCNHPHSLSTVHIVSGECSFEKSRSLPFRDRQYYTNFACDNHFWDVLSPEATMLSGFARSLLFYSLTITTKQFTSLDSPIKLFYYMFKGIFFSQSLN